MKPHQKKWVWLVWWGEKPKGRFKRHVQKAVRQQGKRECRDND